MSLAGPIFDPWALAIYAAGFLAVGLGGFWAAAKLEDNPGRWRWRQRAAELLASVCLASFAILAGLALAIVVAVYIDPVDTSNLTRAGQTTLGAIGW